MTPRMGLIPVHGVCLSYLSLPVSKPSLTPASLFCLLSQCRLSKSLMCGREVNGGNWFFQGTRDGDIVGSVKRTDWGTGHGTTELYRGCARNSPMGDTLARAAGMGAHVQLTGIGDWGSPSAFPRVERGALLPAWGHA